MEEVFIENKTFEQTDFKAHPLRKGEYENCLFDHCSFAGGDLSGIKFTDCRFRGCDLSLAKLNQAAFRDAAFTGCKMLGLRFENCSEFGLSFRFADCLLNHCTFYKTRIPLTEFRDCRLRETDFSECDLSGASFENCDLSRAVFHHSNLEKADFRGALNYSIDPEQNRLKKARFSLNGIPGLLDKYDIEID